MRADKCRQVLGGVEVADVISADRPTIAHRIQLALGLMCLVLAIEVVGGLVAHSLALLSDAGHVLADIGAIALVWLATRQATRPADERRTWGYHRAEILAALANAGVLLVIVVLMVVSAVGRLGHPEPVVGSVVIVVASLGLIANAAIAALVHGHGANLNMRALIVHVWGDLASSAAVLVAGVVITVVHWYPIDPLLALAIAALIAWSAAQILWQSLAVLMEGVPSGMRLSEVESAITTTEGVLSVHDLHVWALTPERRAASAHVVLSSSLDLKSVERVLNQVSQTLCQRFDLTHTVLQPEGTYPCTGDEDCTVDGHNHRQTVAAADPGREDNTGTGDRANQR